MAKGANGSWQERSLGDLLDSLERANQRDVHDYAGGHLNESRLPRPVARAQGHASWETAERAGKKYKGPSEEKKNASRDDEMKAALVSFSMGSDGFLPRAARPSSDDNRSGLDKRVLIEELDTSGRGIRDLFNSPGERPWAAEDADAENLVTKGKLKSRNLEKLRSHLALPNGATKSDHYKDMRLLEDHVIRKYEAQERNVMSGEMAVKYLEDKLREELNQLGSGHGTTFHRLQIHSGILDELIDSSPLFGYLLKRIKDEYDRYVSHLLDNPPTQSHVLREQAKSLADKRISSPRQLQKEKANLVRLEDEGKKLLSVNDRLREEMEKEQDLLKEPIEPEVPKRSTYREEQQISLADQLEDLHSTILERMDKINELKQRLREEYVPNVIVQQLEQCVKETELEIQKLLKQNELLEKGIEEMESTIQSAVKHSETSERDRQRLWAKINTTRVQGCNRRFSSFEEYTAFLREASAAVRTNRVDPFDEKDSSSEEDEAETSKWNWYIS